MSTRLPSDRIKRSGVPALARAILVGASVPAAASGQLLPAPPEPSMSKTLPMQSILYDAERLSLAEGISPEQLADELGNRSIRLRDDGKVHVEVIGPPGAAAVANDVLEPFGGEIETVWRHRADGWIPVGKLSAVAGALPTGYFLARADVPGFDEVEGEGPDAIGSAGYRDAGADGTGLVIAIIDSGYEGLSAARASGDAPPEDQTTEINYTWWTDFESDGTHGTGCVEAAYDHCPGATWRLYKIAGLADMGSAVADAMTNGVRIISHSLSRYNQGWGDSSGDACAAATLAVDNGILFFTSAGNRAEQHWQGMFDSGAGNVDWHDFGPADETIDIVFPPWVVGTFYLSWDTSGGGYDYDLYLYDDALQILESSTSGGEAYEEFSWWNDSDDPRTVHLAVWRVAGGATEFELFVHGGGDWQEYIVAQGSTTSPSNTTHENVLSIGAVTWASFGDPPGSPDIIADYSSRGPSNSGMVLPDLCGPTDTAGLIYPPPFGFGGTSCATPNAAGAACAFWSAHPLFDASAVGWLMRQQAGIYKDWGDAGPDNTYGRGGAALIEYAPGTVWVSRDYGNTEDATTGPFYHVQVAYDVTPSGGRIVCVPGGEYPEPLVFARQMHLVTIGGMATLGE